LRLYIVNYIEIIFITFISIELTLELIYLVKDYQPKSLSVERIIKNVVEKVLAKIVFD